MSMTRPSAVATRRPQLMTLPSALICAGLQRDGADERNFELERRTAHAFVEHRLDGQAHTAVQKGRREAAVHCPPWIKVSGRGVTVIATRPLSASTTS